MENTPNRFSTKCVSVKRPQANKCDQVIKDIKWYPEEKKLVVEKYNQPDIVLDITKSAVATTTDNIYKDPASKLKVIIKKDTPITEALQIITNEMNNILVWNVWE